MGGIGKPSRRGDRVCLADPEGRVFKALGRRLAPLAMRTASRRGAILAQGLENTVPPVINTRTGSSPLAAVHEVITRREAQARYGGPPASQHRRR